MMVRMIVELGGVDSPLFFLYLGKLIAYWY